MIKKSLLPCAVLSINVDDSSKKCVSSCAAVTCILTSKLRMTVVTRISEVSKGTMDTLFDDRDDANGLSKFLSVPAGEVDVAAFINGQFSDEESLDAGLPSLRAKLRETTSLMDSALSDKLRTSRAEEAVSAARIEAAESIADTLSTQLRELQHAAAAASKASHASIESAEPSYIALTNTRTTASALEALVNLHDATVRLESAAASQSLADIAADKELYPSIRASLAALEIKGSTYGPGLRRVPELRARVNVASETLRRACLQDFRACGEVVTAAAMNGGPDDAKLHDAIAKLQTVCEVSSLIGDEVQGEVIGAYIHSRMMAFRAAFEMDKSGLAGIDRRVGWVRRELRVNWADLGGEKKNRGWGSVFPSGWDVHRRIAVASMRELGTWVCKTLDAGADRDVVAMVGALGKSKEFEIELNRRFENMGRGNAGAIASTEYRRNGQSGADDESESGDKPGFIGMLSGCFGPYMNSYVDQEDEHLRITFVDLLRSETWTCKDGSVLKSSTDLFLAIKKSMRMCAALDSRQSLFSLYKIFMKHLGAYATELVRRIPAPAHSAEASVAAPTAAENWIVPKPIAGSMNAPDFRLRVDTACALIATAEYCASTVEQLEDSLREIVEEAYAQEVTMAAVRDRFSTTAAKSVRSLVAVVGADLVLSLRCLKAMNWSEWPSVGDSSPYVDNVAEKINKIVRTLVNKLAKPHLRFFVEKLGPEVIPQLSACIKASGPMNHTGAQQLLLDVTTLRGHLLNISTLAEIVAPAMFAKYINREMGKIEALLKVVLCPADMSVATFMALIPDGSPGNLQHVLEMKGMSRAESAPLLLEYSRLVGPQASRQDADLGEVGKYPGVSNPSSSTEQDRVDKFQSVSGLANNIGGTDSWGAAISDKPSGLTPSDAAANPGSNAAESSVESMRNLWRNIGSSWDTLKDAGLAGRINDGAGRLSESLGSTAEQVKRRFGTGGGRQ